MCLIGVAWKAHPDIALLVASNRDEFHTRATAPSGWWALMPQVLGGRDLQSGGTWMGVTRSGRFAALTNFRDAREFQPDAPSRGALVANFLTGNMASGDYVTGLGGDAARYNGFNLLAGTPDQLWYLGNRGAGAQLLPPGVYGLSNALLDTPWPKVNTLKSALGAVIRHPIPEEPLVPTDSAAPSKSFSAWLAPLFEALGNSQPSADAQLPDTGVSIERERQLSSAKIVSPLYGTRVSTALCVTQSRHVYWEERSFAADGSTTGIVRERFALT